MDKITDHHKNIMQKQQHHFDSAYYRNSKPKTLPPSAGLGAKDREYTQTEVQYRSKMGSSDSGVGVKAGVDSIFDQLDIDTESELQRRYTSFGLVPTAYKLPSSCSALVVYTAVFEKRIFSVHCTSSTLLSGQPLDLAVT